MSLKTRLLTPGPTQAPEETLLELAKQVTHHRTPEAKEALAAVMDDLKYVFQTSNPVLVLTSSGTGGMESAVSNCLAAGDKAILLIAGRWGDRFRKLCQTFGVDMHVVEVPNGKAVTPAQLEQALKECPDAKAVFATLSETSTGVGHDIAAFGKIVANTDAILIVDAISGLGCVECRTDEWNVDVCITGSQKGLMLPPGLAFISVSDKAWKRIEANKQKRVFYFDLLKYRAKAADHDTPYTPANTLIKAQRLSLKRFRDEGIENVWARHAQMARAARAGVSALGLELFSERPTDGLTVIKVPSGVDGKAVLKRLEHGYGLKYADGQDELKGKIWRLAHMGYCDIFDVLAGISGLELVLLEQGFSFEPGAGVAAAQRALVAG